MAPTASKRRWTQFGLKGLFVAITLLGIWLGVMVGRARHQAAVVREVEGMGGTVWFEDDRAKFVQFWQNPDRIRSASSPGPEWLCRLLGDDYFRNVVQLDLGGGPARRLDTEKFEHLSIRLGRLPALQTLRLNSGQHDDAALTYLVRLTKLKNLTVDGFPLTDEDMRHLGRLTSLETLNLPWTEVTDDGLRHLGNLTRLRRLRLYSLAVTAQGIESITALPNLRELILYDCDVTEAELAESAEVHRGLQASIYYQQRIPLGKPSTDSPLPMRHEE